MRSLIAEREKYGVVEEKTMSREAKIIVVSEFSERRERESRERVKRVELLQGFNIEGHFGNS